MQRFIQFSGGTHVRAGHLIRVAREHESPRERIVGGHRHLVHIRDAHRERLLESQAPVVRRSHAHAIAALGLEIRAAVQPQRVAGEVERRVVRAARARHQGEGVRRPGIRVSGRERAHRRVRRVVLRKATG